jgi:hypothetical protein
MYWPFSSRIPARRKKSRDASLECSNALICARMNAPPLGVVCFCAEKSNFNLMKDLDHHEINRQAQAAGLF